MSISRERVKEEEKIIESAFGRKAYQVACGKVWAFQKAMRQEAGAKRIGELGFMYPKCKALLDELSKI